MILSTFCGCMFAVEIDKKETKFQEMWKDIEPWSRCIEVVYQTEEQKEILTRVYFPYDPEVGWT